MEAWRPREGRGGFLGVCEQGGSVCRSLPEPDILAHFANFDVVYYDFAGQARTELPNNNEQKRKAKFNISL